MPLSDKQIGTNAAYYSVTDNPIFQVKLRSLANDLEQKTNKDKKQQYDKEDQFKVGDSVTGKDINNKKSHSGKISAISDSSITIIEFNTKKKIVLDLTTVKKNKKESSTTEPLYFATENKLLDYKDFVKLNKDYEDI